MGQGMTLKRAREIAHTLSKTTKMPGASYGIPARYCNTGSKLACVPGSVCSHCYAQQGLYSLGKVQIAQQKRYDSLEHPEWEDAMVKHISSACKKEPYFRWHDSGDIKNLTHLERIVNVVRRTPEVSHWLPTKEVGIVLDYLPRVESSILDNLVIRVSHPMIDKVSPRIASLGLPTSTVHTTPGKPLMGVECPAYLQDGSCGECRLCWDKDVDNVSFLIHTHKQLETK